MLSLLKIFHFSMELLVPLPQVWFQTPRVCAAHWFSPNRGSSCRQRSISLQKERKRENTCETEILSAEESTSPALAFCPVSSTSSSMPNHLACTPACLAAAWVGKNDLFYLTSLQIQCHFISLTSTNSRGVLADNEKNVQEHEEEKERKTCEGTFSRKLKVRNGNASPTQYSRRCRWRDQWKDSKETTLTMHTEVLLRYLWYVGR